MLLMEASIHQYMGNDDEALSALLKAYQAVASLDEDDAFLKHSRLASVLNDIG